MKRANRLHAEDKTQRTLVQVAHLYYDENLSQKEIADRLGVSRSSIAHYLQQARESGIVRIEIIDPENTSTELEDALREATGVEHVTVIPNPRGSQLLTLRAVAGAAARYITAQLDDGDSLGLAWGRTTSRVVNLLEPGHARGINVLPLMGDSSHTGLHSQMNQLVMQAAQTLGANAHFMSLPMVVSSAALRNALVKETGIREVIDRWDHLDVACVGVGVLPPVPGMIVYIGEDYVPKLMAGGAVGDMCGIYFDGDGKVIKSGLESRMIAAGMDKLDSADFLVAVAAGAEKAVAVLGALRTGLISALFIDRHMAEQILARLNARAAPQMRSARQA